MRKGIVILLLACLLVGLCACVRENAAPSALEFQDIAWNSSPEEVFEKLGLDMETMERGAVETDSVSDHFYITVAGWDVFGEKALTAYFRFDNYCPETSDYFGFSAVQIFYPEDCDKEAILAKVRDQYGPEAREYTLYSIVDGKPEERRYIQEEGSSCWFSQRLVGDALSGQGKQAYRRALGSISDEGFEACLAAPAARIEWTADYYGQFADMEHIIPEDGHVARLSISGGSLALVLQEFENAQ